MEDKDRKYYSNPSHGKIFGHYSPPVPSYLLEKLAAMRVNNRQNNQPEQTSQSTVNQAPHTMDSSPMEGIQHQLMERNTKNNRIGTNLGQFQAEFTLEYVPVNQASQGKRQKIEDISRVGAAKQASPQP
jgi:hypothetical protein